VGAEYDLTDLNTSSFLEGIAGLGYSTELEYVQLGDAQLVTSRHQVFSDVSGNLYLRPGAGIQDPYAEYKTFTAFAAKTPLTLCYRTPDMDTDDYFARAVEVANIEKGEVDGESNTLVCPLTLHPLEPWRSPVEWDVLVFDAGEITEGKDYPLTRPYVYLGSSSDSITLLNASDMPVPLLISIEAADGQSMESVTYALSDEREILYGMGRFTDIPNITKLEISSDPANEYIAAWDGDAAVVNAFAYQDISVGSDRVLATFLLLAPGTSNMVFTFNGEFEGTVTIAKARRYATV
jgi:hypothetical protein